jgi:hypothetical protein
MAAPYAARPGRFTGETPQILGPLGRPAGEQIDRIVELGGDMAANRHPRPFAHAEMRIVRQRSDQMQAVGERNVLDRSHHEARPAAHRVGGMIAQCIENRHAAMIEHEMRSQCHPACHTLRSGTAHRLDSLLTDRGNGAGQQRCEIYGQTFGQRRGLDRAGVQLRTARRIDVHDAVPFASSGHCASPAAMTGLSFVAVARLPRTRRSSAPTPSRSDGSTPANSEAIH